MMVLKIIAVVLLMLLLFYVGLHAFYAYKVINPKKSKNPKTPADYDMKYVDFETRTKNGLTIRGWYMVHETGAKGILILSHNVGANKGKMLQYAKFLYTAGYHIVLYDLHSHGESDHERLEFRTVSKSQNDLLAVIDKVKQETWYQNSNQKIGLMGFSLGTINTVGVYGMMPEIKLAITDCGPFAELNETFYRTLKRTVPKYKIIWRPLFNLFIKIWLFDSYDEYMSQAIKGMASRPLFVIHGQKDFIILPEQSKSIYDKIQSDKKEYWLVPGSYHLTAYNLYKKEYEEKVLSFLEKYMGND